MVLYDLDILIYVGPTIQIHFFCSNKILLSACELAFPHSSQQYDKLCTVNT